MNEKKNRFAGAFDSLMQTQPVVEQTTAKNPVGRPPKDGIQREGANTGLPEEWQRYTLIINKQVLQDLKDYAWYERISIKDAVDTIFRDYLDKADFERPKQK
ncbi:MAG: hypothetical protein UHX00_01230 [Caryophanon sp.]|nr:hypothetical protein [Caryophanon sp.]